MTEPARSDRANVTAQQFLAALDELRRIAPIVGLASDGNVQDALQSAAAISVEDLLAIHTSLIRVLSTLDGMHGATHSFLIAAAIREKDPDAALKAGLMVGTCNGSPLRPKAGAKG